MTKERKPPRRPAKAKPSLEREGISLDGLVLSDSDGLELPEGTEKYEGSVKMPELEEPATDNVVPLRAGLEEGATKQSEWVIRIIPGLLANTIDRAEATLIKSKRPFFERGRRLVFPTVSTLPASHGRETEAVLLKTATIDNVVYRLSKYGAAFMKYDGRSKDWVRVDPPVNVATGLLAKGEWGFRSVVGVITVPTLRPDGSLIDKPGYDPATHLWYHPDSHLVVPPIPEHPTRDQAEAALVLLSNLLEETPFVEAVDLSVALALLLMPILRGGYDVGPMVLFRSPTASSGKSYLMDLASTIATARPCPVITNAKSQDEMEKRLGALLLQGVPMISLDNSEFDIGGELLCTIATQRVLNIRILGKSETPEVEWRGVIGATGNNIGVRGDMTRRSLVSNIDTNMERPELRRFGKDPIDEVLSDRGKYIAAALTIARAWRVAGQPGLNSIPPIASYGQWSRAVRLPLIWLGMPDPVASMDALREDDPEKVAARTLYAGIMKLYPSRVQGSTDSAMFSASDLASAGQVAQGPFPDLYVVLTERCASRSGMGIIEAKKVGWWLRRLRGQIHAGCRLELAQHDDVHGSLYVLRRVGPEGEK